MEWNVKWVKMVSCDEGGKSGALVINARKRIAINTCIISAGSGTLN